MAFLFMCPIWVLAQEKVGDASESLTFEKLNPQWSLGLESNFYAELSHRPSSKQGQSAFDFSELKLDPVILLNPEISMVLRFSLADERSTKTNDYQSQMENAYVRYHQAAQPQWTHELGLIRPYWHRHEGAIDQVDVFGLVSKSLSRRYKYMGLGDLGYQGRYDVSDSSFLAFGLVNGEENNEGENGPSKEGFIGYIFKTKPQSQRTQLVGVWFSHGRVDTVDAQVADRNRAHLRYQIQTGRFLWELEGLWAEDASVDLENEQRAEGMTFAELAEPRNITTQAGRLGVYYTLTDRDQVFLRYDKLDVELSHKGLESWTAAWVQQNQKHLAWGVFYENTLYGAEHSAQPRQRERLRGAISLSF